MRRWMIGVMVAGSMTLPSLVRADEGPAIEAAQGWLGALREKDPARLKSATGFPFSEAGIGPGSGRCGKKAKAANADELDGAFNCMLSDADFVAAIPPHIEAQTTSLKALDVPTFKKNLKALQPLARDHAFVLTTVKGDGVTWRVLLAVRKNNQVTLVLTESTSE